MLPVVEPHAKRFNEQRTRLRQAAAGSTWLQCILTTTFSRPDDAIVFRALCEMMGMPFDLSRAAANRWNLDEAQARDHPLSYGMHCAQNALCPYSLSNSDSREVCYRTLPNWSCSQLSIRDCRCAGKWSGLITKDIPFGETRRIGSGKKMSCL